VILDITQKPHGAEQIQNIRKIEAFIGVGNLLTIVVSFYEGGELVTSLGPNDRIKVTND
jgi:hypothetical protein